MHRVMVALALLGSLLPSTPESRLDVTCMGRTATIVGTLGDDRLIGTPGDDVIAGLAGDDVIRGRGGDDMLCGDEGNDRILPGTGDDIADGGPGFDTLSFSRTRVPVLVDLEAGMALDGGHDTLSSFERVTGSRQGDVLLGSRGADVLAGRQGEDRIDGRGADDLVRGGPGVDELIGGPGFDAVWGGSGADSCSGESLASCVARTVTHAVFVAPDGKDTRDGASIGSAVRTLRRAIDLVAGGGTVVVLPGTFSHGVLFEGDPVGGPYRITGVGGRPVLDGAESRSFGVFCSECRGLTVEWLTVTGFSDIGVGATRSSRVVLRNLRIVDNGHRVRHLSWELEGYGIHVDDSSHVVIEDNVLTRNGPDPPAPGRLLGTAINTFGNTHVEIRRNRAHHNHGAGILVEDSIDALVETNEIYRNDLDASEEGWWDGGIWVDGGADVTVRNNVVRDNRGVGIEVSDEERQLPTGFVIEGNVSTGNYFGIYLWNFRTSGWPPPEIVLVGPGNDFVGNICRDVWIAPRSDFASCP